MRQVRNRTFKASFCIYSAFCTQQLFLITRETDPFSMISDLIFKTSVFSVVVAIKTSIFFFPCKCIPNFNTYNKCFCNYIWSNHIWESVIIPMPKLVYVLLFMRNWKLCKIQYEIIITTNTITRVILWGVLGLNYGVASNWPTPPLPFEIEVQS